MAVISFPLGFKIVETLGTANTGVPIDERLVFSSSSVRTVYDPDFFYEGLFSYVVGLPYHGSGVTSDAGFYYRNSANTWVGLNADTVDDKQANGTMDSSSAASSNPTTGTNIVNHINYLYTLSAASSSGRTWKSAVTTFADLATTYPTPSVGWAAVVNATNIIYIWNGSAWVATSSNSPSLSSSVDGIVSHTWYTTINDIITNTSNYQNQNTFSNISVKNNSVDALGSPVSSTTTTDTFTINATGGLTAIVSGKAITLNSTSTSGVTPTDFTFKFDTGSNYYRPYTDKTEAGGAASAGKFYNGTSTPTATNRLNYDGNLFANTLTGLNSGIGAAITATSTSGAGVQIFADSGTSIIANSNTGLGLLINNTSGNTSLLIDAQVNNVDKFTVSATGDINSLVLNTSGSTQTAGFFYTGTTDPNASHTNRLNYDGYLYSNAFITSLSSGARTTITSDGMLVAESAGVTNSSISAALYEQTVNSVSRTTLNPLVVGTGSIAYLFDTANVLTTSLRAQFLNKGSNPTNILADGSIDIPASTTYKIGGVPLIGIPTLTAGSVIFSNGTTLAENNANFFWDDTAIALKISNTIGQTLIQGGSITIYADASSGGVQSTYLLNGSTISGDSYLWGIQQDLADQKRGGDLQIFNYNSINNTSISVDTISDNIYLNTFDSNSNSVGKKIYVQYSTTDLKGGDFSLTAGSTLNYLDPTFTSLGATSQNWVFMCVAPNGDVYATKGTGDIYMQSGGVGTFNALSQTSRNWQGICATPSGDIYAIVSSGDLYKRTGGTGNFVGLSQTSRSWRGLASDSSGNLYATVANGDIYKRTGTGNFTALGQTSRNWNAITVTPNGDVYAITRTSGGEIYKQTGGTGSFVSLNQNGILSSTAWIGIAASPIGNIYALSDGIDTLYSSPLFVQPFGQNGFINIQERYLHNITVFYTCVTVSSSGLIYISSSLAGNIYVSNSTDASLGTSNLNGGSLILSSGMGKGTGSSNIIFSTATTLSSGTNLQTITEKARILGNGNFGINTTIPAYRLDVNGDINISTGSHYKINGVNLSASDIGSFVLPSLTSGSILFSDGTTIAQNNTKLFWDNTFNRLGIGTNTPVYDITIDGNAISGRSIGMKRDTGTSISGTQLAIFAAGAGTGATNKGGGTLFLSSGIGTGNSSYAAIVFRVYNPVVSGTGDQTLSYAMNIANNGNVSLDAGIVPGLINFSVGRESAKIMGMDRSNTTGHAGSNLTIISGGTHPSASNLRGGTLIFSDGISKGNSTGTSFQWVTYDSTTSGSTDQTSSVKMTMLSNGNLGIGKVPGSYLLDVNGDINISTGNNFKINGTNLASSDVGAEPNLGTPASNGMVLTSTTGNVRSWISITKNNFSYYAANPVYNFLRNNTYATGNDLLPSPYYTVPRTGTYIINFGGMNMDNSGGLLAATENQYSVFVNSTQNTNSVASSYDVKGRFSMSIIASLTINDVIHIMYRSADPTNFGNANCTFKGLYVTITEL
jgi:hypothetical protein